MSVPSCPSEGHRKRIAPTRVMRLPLNRPKTNILKTIPVSNAGLWNAMTIIDTNRKIPIDMIANANIRMCASFIGANIRGSLLLSGASICTVLAKFPTPLSERNESLATLLFTPARLTALPWRSCRSAGSNRGDETECFRPEAKANRFAQLGYQDCSQTSRVV